MVIVYAFFTGYRDTEAGMKGDEHIDAEEYVHLTCCGLVSAAGIEVQFVRQAQVQKSMPT